MKKNFEYKEPEFKVLNIKTEDVISTSIIPDDSKPTLTHIAAGWEKSMFTI